MKIREVGEETLFMDIVSKSFIIKDRKYLKKWWVPQPLFV